MNSEAQPRKKADFKTKEERNWSFDLSNIFGKTF